MRFGLFGKGGADKAARTAGTERVKADVRALLGLSEDSAVAVNEIVCADPACPGTETVVLVMTPGAKTRAFKLQMALAEVTAEALTQALTESDPQDR